VKKTDPRIRRDVADDALPSLREYSQTGGGVVMERNEGTPQGGPLSTLLANVILAEVEQGTGHAGVMLRPICRRS